uniref:Uncharacterized protein n=1 Tax=Meloidogyne floridensis TaxID=298350 RepID=A0A915NY58_9BILA
MIYFCLCFIFTDFIIKTGATDKALTLKISPAINTTIRGLIPFNEQNHAKFGVHMFCNGGNKTGHFGGISKIHEIDANTEKEFKMPGSCKVEDGHLIIYISHILLPKTYAEGEDYNNWPSIVLAIKDIKYIRTNEPKLTLLYEFAEQPFIHEETY